MNGFVRKISALFLMAFITNVFAQNSADSTSRGKMNVFGYPYLFYTPETELAFGVGGIATFYLGKDVFLRPSKIVVAGYYTTNKQYSFSVDPQFYFLGNKYFFSMSIEYEYTIDKYYGIGGDTPEIVNPDYEANIFLVSLEFQLPSFFGLAYKSGFILDYKDFEIVDRKTNPYLTNVSLIANGGKTFGLGALAVWDSRNSIFFPTVGNYTKLKAEFFMDALGSDYDFNIYEIDLRQYYPVFERNTFGFQFFGKFTGGSPPFYELAALGGQYLMRGYYEGRFRDKNYLAAQIEYRRYVWRRIGIVIFGGAGNVVPLLSDFRFRNLKYSYGFGLRYQFNIKEKVNLRADFGFGKETSGVYFGIEEVF